MFASLQSHPQVPPLPRAFGTVIIIGNMRGWISQFLSKVNENFEKVHELQADVSTKTLKFEHYESLKYDVIHRYGVDYLSLSSG
jgi:hypothetical protein